MARSKYNVQLYTKGNNKNENPEPIESFTCKNLTQYQGNVFVFEMEDGEEIYSNMDFIAHKINST